MSVEAAVLLSFACLFLGINNAVGYFYIYKGFDHFKVRNTLKRKGQTVDAEVTKKWTNSYIKSEDDKTKTKYWFTYCFCYQDKQYDINHTIPNIDCFLSIYQSLNIGDRISILFSSSNPSKYNLPKMAMDYPQKKYIFTMMIGNLIVIFGIFLSILLSYLFTNSLNGIIKGLNVFGVLIGYPLLILLIYTNTVCKKRLNMNSSQQGIEKVNDLPASTITHDETQQFVES